MKSMLDLVEPVPLGTHCLTFYPVPKLWAAAARIICDADSVMLFADSMTIIIDPKFQKKAKAN
jgi:hypothetical protein